MGWRDWGSLDLSPVHPTRKVMTMRSRSAAFEVAEVADRVPGEVIDDLDGLSAGALHWIRGNLHFLDPSSANDLPATSKVKAILELALLCRLWARWRPADE